MIQEILQNKSLLDDTYISGTADLSGLIDQKYGDFQYGISIGKRLDDRIIDSIDQGPTLAYYDHYNQINNELTQKAQEIQKELKKTGIDSIITKPTIPIDSKDKYYQKTLSADISHKMVATRAGLGWIGKTDLFISKEYGPRLRLVSILVNRKPGNESIPIEKSRCGKCEICVEKCPANAATGELWNIRVYRDSFFDAHKCRDKCRQLAKERLNINRRICGICVSVCPIGSKNRKMTG